MAGARANMAGAKIAPATSVVPLISPRLRMVDPPIVDANGRASPPISYLSPRIGEKELSRRECQVLDERIGSQFRRVEDRMEMQLRHSQKLQDVLYKKLAEAEVGQSRLERRVFELVGTVNGLSDETQQQVRRAESMDARFLGFRHDLEEQFLQQFGDLQAEVRIMSSRFCAQMATAEQQQQQMWQQNHFDDLETDRHKHGAKLSGAILELRGRMAAMAETEESSIVDQVHHEAAHVHGPEADGLHEKWQHLEKQLTEIGWRLEQAVSDLHDKTSCLAEHEERLKGVQAKLDSQDHFANFDERFRHDWEGRINRMQKVAQAAADGHGEHKEQLVLMRQQADEIQERHVEHEASIKSIYDLYGSLSLDAAESPPANDVVSSAVKLASAMDRLAELDDRVGQLRTELKSTSARVSEIEDRAPHANAFDAKLATLTEHAQTLSDVQSAVAQQLKALNGGQHTVG